MNENKNSDALFEVSCDAKNCVHNDKNCCCTANHIEIGSSSAKQDDETKCKTFKCNC